MSSVYSRNFRSTPYRTALITWEAIVDLLTQGRSDEKKRELQSETGTVASLISDKAPESAPIIVTCEGPRTRIYCLYDDSAIDEDGNEGAVGYDPLKGDWAISVPCPTDDLEWVKRALASQSSRVTARDVVDTQLSSDNTSASASLTLDLKGFLA